MVFLFTISTLYIYTVIMKKSTEPTGGLYMGILMQYIGLAVGVVLCLTGLLVGGEMYIRWQEKKLRELEAQINC